MPQTQQTDSANINIKGVCLLTHQDTGVVVACVDYWNDFIINYQLRYDITEKVFINMG